MVVLVLVCSSSSRPQPQCTGNQRKCRAARDDPLQTLNPYARTKVRIPHHPAEAACARKIQGKAHFVSTGV